MAAEHGPLRHGSAGAAERVMYAGAVHSGLHMSDTFTCPFCHLVFGGRSEFENHLQVEHPDRYRPKPPEHPSPRTPPTSRTA